MDSSDLLARENEFKKLNKQLEKKTESLMKEIENVMQRQDIFSDISYKQRLPPSTVNLKNHSCGSTEISRTSSVNNFSNKNLVTRQSVAKKNTNTIVKDNGEINSISNEDQQQNIGCLQSTTEYTCSSQIGVNCQNCTVNKSGRLSNDIEFIYAFVSINVKDNILPESFLKERVTVENVCKFLSAKVKLLQEQIAKMQKNMEKRGEQCEGHLAQIAELEGEKMSLLSRAKRAEADLAEGRAKYMALQAHIEEKDRLYKEQRSAADKLSTQLKQLLGRSRALEGRCAAQEGAADGLRQRLAGARAQLTEFRESSRALSASHEAALGRLQAQQRRLAACLRRQNALIDNLRQQNALLALQATTASLDSEYEHFLKQDL